jgi:hypothetical protein
VNDLPVVRHPSPPFSSSSLVLPSRRLSYFLLVSLPNLVGDQLSCSLPPFSASSCRRYIFSSSFLFSFLSSVSLFFFLFLFFFSSLHSLPLASPSHIPRHLRDHTHPFLPPRWPTLSPSPHIPPSSGSLSFAQSASPSAPSFSASFIHHRGSYSRPNVPLHPRLMNPALSDWDSTRSCPTTRGSRPSQSRQLIPSALAIPPSHAIGVAAQNHRIASYPLQHIAVVACSTSWRPQRRLLVLGEPAHANTFTMAQRANHHHTMSHHASARVIIPADSLDNRTSTHASLGTFCN